MFLQVHIRLLHISVDNQHFNNLRTSTLSPSIFTRYIYSEYLNIPSLYILATCNPTHSTCPQCIQFEHLNTISCQWTMECVHCILQTFAPDLHVLGEHSARSGGAHTPHASGEADCGDVDQGDCCCRTFSQTIPLHLCSCALNPCPNVSTRCLIAALLARALVSESRAPCFGLTLL